MDKNRKKCRIKIQILPMLSNLEDPYIAGLVGLESRTFGTPAIYLPLELLLSL